jgi:hypothetical protein
MPGSFDGRGQLSLVPCASSGDPSRDDFAPLGLKPAQPFVVLIVDLIDFGLAESADFSSSSSAKFESRHSVTLPDINGQ